MERPRDPGKQSPLERMRSLGRLPKGRMNNLEKAYSERLALLRHAGEVLWFKFEPIKLRLADNTFYEPDFAVMVASGELEMHEVKGFWTDDARVKIKVAADQFPFRFIAVQRDDSCDWKTEEF
ncbi:hypothetical protein WJ73_19525 [Burkholderia ubonensis]|nr:hypothetical protein WJ73_19525 [Burkholderia ubonensis]